MSTDFNVALDAYRAEVQRRRPALCDCELGNVDRRADCAFWQMVRAPARTLRNTVVKGEAMLSEYGECGELRTDLVEVLLGDMRDLPGYSASP